MANEIVASRVNPNIGCGRTIGPAWPGTNPPTGGNHSSSTTRGSERLFTWWRSTPFERHRSTIEVGIPPLGQRHRRGTSLTITRRVGLRSPSRCRIIRGLPKPKWRNWQTRWIQNPVPSGECGFESHLRYWPASSPALNSPQNPVFCGLSSFSGSIVDCPRLPDFAARGPDGATQQRPDGAKTRWCGQMVPPIKREGVKSDRR